MAGNTSAREISGEVKRMMEAAAALAALARVPLFRDAGARALRVEPLGGLTNRNFKVIGPAGCYVLRLAGAGSGAFVDRAAEAENARIAAEAGVGAEVVYCDAADGTMVTRFVAGAAPMDARGMQDEGAIGRAAAVLRRLHGAAPFANDVDPFAKIAEYRALADEGDVALPQGTAEAVAAVAEIRRALAARPAPPAPCHFDPTPANFLDTGARMVLIDYEYAGNGDPLWDLAYLAVEAGFAEAQERGLLAAYFGRPPETHERARMALYAPVCDLLAALWGALRAEAEDRTDDFRVYAVDRIERCRARLDAPALRRHMESLRRG